MQISKHALIDAAKRFARAHRGKLSAEKFCRAAYWHQHAINRYFPGGFYNLLKAAGLADRVGRRMNIPTDELLAEYHRAHTTLKRPPGWRELRKLTRFTDRVFRARFRTKPALAKAYDDWKLRSLPLSPAQAESILATPPSAPADPRSRSSVTLPLCHSATPPLSHPRRRKQPSDPARDNDFRHGAPLGFRGLAFAPTSEAGVIHLFGLLGPDLGYAIVSIRAGFPDCLALRPSKACADHWDPCRIEFEFKASHFPRHGHDHTQCDLIVCWENDWPDAPIPVIDLKSEVAKARQPKSAA